MFVMLFASIWLLLDATYVALPLIRAGATIISDAKFERLVGSAMFERQDRERVMFLGNSKALSGVRPREFDAAVGPGTRSYNLGLPGKSDFLPILEAALLAGNVPTHVLLTVPWDDRVDRPGIVDALRDDAAIGDALFPFRTLPRDAILFAYNSRLRPMEAARDADRQRDLMVAQRGWYFIKGQSHFPDDRLPEGYTLPTDHPNQPEVRKVPTRSLARERLERLAVQYRFQVLLVPSFSRAGEVGPPPATDQARLTVASEFPLIRVLGPDYWIYPPSNFSDPIHLNPVGALAYTNDLAQLAKKNGIFD